MNRLGRAQVGLLREIADADAWCEVHVPQKLLVDARHDAKQRALARAIPTQHADLGAEKERQIDVLENALLRGMDARDLLHGEDELCHAPALARAPPSSGVLLCPRHAPDARATTAAATAPASRSEPEERRARSGAARFASRATGPRSDSARSARTRAAHATPRCL